MWLVRRSSRVQHFWSATDQFVRDFLDHAHKLQKRGLSRSELRAAAAQLPGDLERIATNRVQAYLVQFAECHDLPAIIRGFSRTVRMYNTYLTYPEPSMRPFTAETHDLTQQAFRYFYEELINTKGFRETYLGLSGPGRTGQEYRKLFGNEHRTCPYCDQEMIAKLTNCQIDHLLPKAQHPLLALHGGNLVVSCTSCNAGEKASKPLGHTKDGVENLPIFHPFLEQPADHIRLRFNRAVTRVWVRGSGLPGSLSALKVKHWATVFGLETQYAAHLPSLKLWERSIRRQVIDEYRKIVRAGGRPDLAQIYDEVLTSKEEECLEQRGFEPGSKLKLDFLYHLRTQRRGEDLTYLQSELGIAN